MCYSTNMQLKLYLLSCRSSEVETHIRNDDGKLWVECVVHLADGSFVTPERVVVLTVFGIRVTGRGEHLVPGRGVGVRLRDAVWRLPANPKHAQ